MDGAPEVAGAGQQTVTHALILVPRGGGIAALPRRLAPEALL